MCLHEIGYSKSVLSHQNGIELLQPLGLRKNKNNQHSLCDLNVWLLQIHTAPALCFLAYMQCLPKAVAAYVPS